MADEQSFKAAVLAEPTDDSLRLIFADWLEEQGDARAEYIRLSVARRHAKDNFDVPSMLREVELLTEFMTPAPDCRCAGVTWGQCNKCNSTWSSLKRCRIITPWLPPARAFDITWFVTVRQWHLVLLGERVKSPVLHLRLKSDTVSFQHYTCAIDVYRKQGIGRPRAERRR